MFKRIKIQNWNQTLACDDCHDAFYQKWNSVTWISIEESKKDPFVCRTCGGSMWSKKIGRKIITYNDWIFFTANRKVRWELKDV